MTFKLNLQFHSIFHIRKTSTTNCVKKQCSEIFYVQSPKVLLIVSHMTKTSQMDINVSGIFFAWNFYFLPVVFCSLLFKLILFFYFPKIELKLHNSYQYIVGHHSHITVILLLKVVAHVAQWLESLELQLKNANYLILW